MEDKAWVDVISGIEEEDLVSVEVIDKLIAEHQKAIKDNRAEIKKSQRSIENLEFKKKKLKYGDNTILFEIADQVHEKYCMSCYSEPSHCTYRMTNWDRYLAGDEWARYRGVYVEKAKGIVEKAKELNISIRKAMKLINEI